MAASLTSKKQVKNANMIIRASHIAVLVTSVRKAADHLRQFDFQIGPEEIWDGEGTREIYIEKEKSNSLLLMEPIKSGAYQRAMEKRGPGLHHIAIDVLDFNTYLSTLTDSGWVLHPISAQTIKKSRIAYLSRPGFPSLIEVQEREELLERPLFITELFLPLRNGSNTTAIERLGISSSIRYLESPEAIRSI